MQCRNRADDSRSDVMCYHGVGGLGVNVRESISTEVNATSIVVPFAFTTLGKVIPHLSEPSETR